MNLSDWRKSNSATLSQTAAMLGLTGMNPARTLQRVERGERMPSAVMIEAIESVTQGAVTAQDLYEVRLAWEKANATAAVSE